MEVSNIYSLRALLLVLPLTFVACGNNSNDESILMAEEVSSTSAAPDTLGAVDSLLVALAPKLEGLTMGEAVQTAGRAFLGRPYVAGMLDRSESETLVVDITSFDCVLLVEAAVAAARTVREGNLDASGFADQIKKLRYRSGELDGYCSRLHYFSDWIGDNEQKGIVTDITEQAGGVEDLRTIDFMSTNRSLYKQIATDDSLFAGIVDVEDSLRNRKRFYIPQSRIRESYSRIAAGDIIAITTSVKGLDISHTGIAHVDDNGVGFLHASTASGVVVAPDLSDYVNGNSKQTGIVIVRPSEVSE